ncbi:MAG: hypothetical protein CMF21_06315 [Idiomarinaceae bacterium]|nr:hypothetical protein [Idiomarinaceae bacterium]
MKYGYIIGVCSVVLASLVVGCGDRPITVREACNSDPTMCSDLNQDNWCNAERRQLILTRYSHKMNPSAESKYYLLKDLQNYSQCIELASAIEHKKLKEKQSHRIEAYINSLRNIEKRAQETRQSEHPLLLYWHWANRNNQAALKRLLALEGAPIMQTSELQFALATYYAKENTDKMLAYLYRALRLYQPGQRFNVEIPESLATYYLNQGSVDKAYVWSLVAVNFKSKVLDVEQLDDIFTQPDERKKQLRDIADRLTDRITEGRFNLRPDWSVPTN